MTNSSTQEILVVVIIIFHRMLLASKLCLSLSENVVCSVIEKKDKGIGKMDIALLQ